MENVGWFMLPTHGPEIVCVYLLAQIIYMLMFESCNL